MRTSSPTERFDKPPPKHPGGDMNLNTSAVFMFNIGREKTKL